MTRQVRLFESRLYISLSPTCVHARTRSRYHFVSAQSPLGETVNPCVPAVFLLTPRPAMILSAVSKAAVGALRAAKPSLLQNEVARASSVLAVNSE